MPIPISIQKKNHWNYGNKYTDEFRKKLSEAHKGKNFTEEHKKNLSLSHIGKKHSEETKRKLSFALKGKIAWNRGKIGYWAGKHRNEIAKMKMRNSHLGKKHNKEWKRKVREKLKGNKNGLGYKHTIKWKEQQRKRFLGKNNHQWQGGISFEPYISLFNQQLKDKIRVRDNFICQLCRIPELECNKRLAIHHIDYNKKNCNENNLISLCIKCNTKVNFNREYWKRYFKNLMEERYVSYTYIN